MKKSTLTLICLLWIMATAGIARANVRKDQQLRDSIFLKYRSIAEPSDRIYFMRSMFYTNINDSWALILLDSALHLSISVKDIDSELDIRNDYYLHYKFQSNLPEMELYFGKLKEACIKHQSYKFYFQTWNDILQYYNVKGDTEYTRVQSLKMKEEAKNLNDATGIAYSNISLARSLAAAKKEKEAIPFFREALESTAIKPLTRALIHSEIITTYQQIGENNKAIKELDQQKSVLKAYIDNIPARAAQCRENLLEMELAYCTAYDNLNDTDNLLKHLNEAKKHYHPNCFSSNYIGYHAYRGAYYRLTRQWKDCIQSFDTALARFDKSQPLHLMKIQRMKGNALVEASQYKEAAILFKELSIMGDSLNQNVIRLHKEALQANYNIRTALLEKTTLEAQYYWLIISLVLALVLAVFWVVIRTRKANKSLLRTEQETRKALETVDSANQMKEIFLRNITFQIREPLNIVVGFTSILATENGLSPEETQEYSTAIKKNATLLFKLIIDVLDLSRLESGMMKFNVSESDAVQLCKEAKMAIEIQHPNTTHLLFETDLETLPILTDNERFLKVLLSLLSAPDESRTITSTKYTLHREANQLKIIVTNSALLQQPESIQRIRHDINRLFFTTFKGTYNLLVKQNQTDITLTYPLLQQ